MVLARVSETAAKEERGGAADRGESTSAKMGEGLRDRIQQREIAKRKNTSATDVLSGIDRDIGAGQAADGELLAQAPGYSPPTERERRTPAAQRSRQGRSPDYQKGYDAGYKRGLAAGQLAMLSDTLEEDLKKIDAVIQEHGSAGEKREWQTSSQMIKDSIKEAQKGIEGNPEQFDPIAVLRDMKLQMRLVKTYGLLAARLEKSQAPRSGGGIDIGGLFQGPGGGSNIRLLHGDILSLHIFDKYLEPLLQQVIKDGKIQTRPSKEQLDSFRSIGEKWKAGLRSDVEKIKREREANRRKRLP